MKDILAWLNDALASKELVTGMTHYRVANHQIKATDGRITAAHPWPYDGEFLAPGNEFEKILQRCPDDPELTIINQTTLKMRSGRFHGTIQTLPISHWDHPGVDDAQWQPVPKQLALILKSLRPFVSDNATQPWALSVALVNGWAYATNNIAIAGRQCEGLENINALLPVWAIDFMLSRAETLSDWCWTDHYVAFRWENGAWMRSQLNVGQFPEQAATLVHDAFNENPTQHITEEFRDAFRQVSGLADDTVSIYKDRIEGKFGRAVIADGAESEVPEGSECSIWGAKFLSPVLEMADSWSPAMWPKPVPFKGPLVAGYVVGRKM